MDLSDSRLATPAVTAVPAPWVVLVPVKATTVGKSRILLEPARRARLARAMAMDTVTAVAAARSVRRVVVLVEDDDDGRALAGIPGVVMHHSPVRGLNESIVDALALPALAGSRVAVLPADLPSLRPGEVDSALRSATHLALAVVADRQGTGTTLLAAGRAGLLLPHYGPGSFAAHLAAGAVPIAVPSESGLRRDVDVLADLDGVTGPRTRAQVDTLGSDTAVG